MKKTLSLVLTLLILAALFAGCGSASKLPEGFDEAEVIATAENAVTTLNSADYEALCALWSEELRNQLTPESFESAVDQVMPDAGEFVEFTSETVSSQKDADGNDFVVALLVAKYENQKVTFTISVDKDLMLIGFYLK
ncbi:MAG: DUF3887 domain-containing protein [Clostridia bacterium]|nr:DUF3887 domain-containing protein [Clostridia bacterium]NCC69517.1 DUF3887 domain-containing protein [Clostridia bacterium]